MDLPCFSKLYNSDRALRVKQECKIIPVPLQIAISECKTVVGVGVLAMPTEMFIENLGIVCV